MEQSKLEESYITRPGQRFLCLSLGPFPNKALMSNSVENQNGRKNIQKVESWFWAKATQPKQLNATSESICVIPLSCHLRLWCTFYFIYFKKWQSTLQKAFYFGGCYLSDIDWLDWNYVTGERLKVWLPTRRLSSTRPSTGTPRGWPRSSTTPPTTPTPGQLFSQTINFSRHWLQIHLLQSRFSTF